jgi:thioredoxin reductase (NADPH)
MNEVYDVAIIGAGVSGLSAGMYSARLGLKTIIFGKSNSSELAIGGVITTTHLVENYPGFNRLSGNELAEKIRAHAEEYDLVEIKEEETKIVKRDKDLFVVSTNKGEYTSKTIIFATGTKWKKLEVPGGIEFENKGVAYCALCDAPLYKNKIVGVIGGGDSAVKDALLLSEYASKVYIIYRGENLRPEPINLERVKKNKKIVIINNTNVIEVKGNKRIESLILDKSYEGKKELKIDGLFVAIGHIVLSELAEKIGVKLNDKKEIIINHKSCETNVKGIFAAGDVADKPFKQAITGVAEGCTASHSAYEYIKKELE